MGMSEREHHIKALENLISYYKGYYDSTLKDSVEALHYAISSLKTDEAYQLMYEGEEIYTKDDVVAMLEELKTEIEELQGKYSPYYDEASQHTSEIIQQKIDKLRGDNE